MIVLFKKGSWFNLFCLNIVLFGIFFCSLLANQYLNHLEYYGLILKIKEPNISNLKFYFRCICFFSFIYIYYLPYERPSEKKNELTKK